MHACRYQFFVGKILLACLAFLLVASALEPETLFLDRERKRGGESSWEVLGVVRYGVGRKEVARE